MQLVEVLAVEGRDSSSCLTASKMYRRKALRSLARVILVVSACTDRAEAKPATVMGSVMGSVMGGAGAADCHQDSALAEIEVGSL